MMKTEKLARGLFGDNLMFFLFFFSLFNKTWLVVIHRTRLSKATLMNTHNTFYGEIEILLSLYRQMPSLSVSYLHKFPVALF